MENTQYSQTQASTQTKDDPRRYGRNNSGLSEEDLTDVFCILHPASRAAYDIVQTAALHTPQHILQNQGRSVAGTSQVSLQEQETFRLDQTASHYGLDLALRFSSRTIEPWTGFVFGRNSTWCDIVITIDTVKRVSNKHFSIYLNENGILMLQDMSTNGTMVDEVHLKKGKHRHRMLNQGSIIHIASTKADEVIKFIIRLPPRDEYVQKYSDRFHDYMRACAAALAQKQNKIPLIPGKKPLPVAAGIQERAAPRMIVGESHSYGMHWNGGTVYNVIGILGKGAFATVYKVATALDGRLLAAKELDKSRFARQGNLDDKIANEMHIMKTLRHKNIVEYIAYKEFKSWLYIIMEYIPHGDLQEYLQEKKVLAEPKAKTMSRQVFSALAYLHERKIVHRDIKPDNLLIASHEPFEVKLTDFGLSKETPEKDAFMKTFCGTLLYCAPEVFPQYKDHDSKGMKRRRGEEPDTHRYGYKVDVWSYAAVLWFALAGKPPFEGVPDATGRGMFEQITGNRPDTSLLHVQNTSAEAIDLLCLMLETNPTKRPDELQCLEHSWLNDGTVPLFEGRLVAIEEEGEEGEDEAYASAGAEEQFSQMSLHGRRRETSHDREPEPWDSPEFKALFAGPRTSKRFKRDPLFPRNQTRDKETTSDSEDPMQDAVSLEESGVFPNGRAPQPRQAPKLFGEIGASALEDSGVLDAKTHEALKLREQSTSVEQSDAHSSILRYSMIHGSMYGSLDGTDSHFRNLGIANEQAATATPEGTNGHTPTPKMPFATPLNGSDGQEELTPKAPVQPKFDRRIQLPPDPSFFYDPLDPSTHTLEYATRVSGIDFVKMNATKAATSALAQATGQGATQSASAVTYPRLPTLPDGPVTQFDGAPSADGQAQYPDRMHIAEEDSTSQSNLPSSSPRAVSTQSSATSSQFVKPGPRYGRLVSTRNSVASITINLDKHNTSFGRADDRDVQYHPDNDTRVARHAFNVWFYHPQLDEYVKEGKDWSQLPGLFSGIMTFSTVGIWINDVFMRSRNRHGSLQFGQIHTGDVIGVFKDNKSKTKLEFKVELFKGDGALPREKANKFTIMHEARDQARDQARHG